MFSLIVLQIQFHIGADTTPVVSGEAQEASNLWRRTTAFQSAGDYSASTDGLGFPMRPVAVRVVRESEIGYPGITKQ